MASAQNQVDKKPSKGIDFAILTPWNKKAVDNFIYASDAILKQPSRHHHHFCRFNNHPAPGDNGPTASDAPSNPVRNPSTTSATVAGPEKSFSTATTERASDDEGTMPSTGHYALNLEHLPLRPDIGWCMGKGNWEKGTVGEVDLLVAEREEIYPRHINFQFNANGQLELHARHGKVELDGELVPRNSSRILSHTNFIKLGPLSYRFDFVVPEAEEYGFQMDKTEFLKQKLGMQQEPNQLISATPSATDLKIEDWVIKGIAGHTPKSVIEAALNLRTSDKVAVKRMRRSDDRQAQRIQQELDIYDALCPIKKHRFGRYVMYMHSVLYKGSKKYLGSPDEVYLLWHPLASTTFQSFSPTGQWASVADDVKINLFCQVCFGVRAVHEQGWIHRDIKPLNLYVVSLLPPHAVVGDFGTAVRRSNAGLTQQPGQLGTINYMAPELESKRWAKKKDSLDDGYNHTVDVWSLGAVAYFLFERKPFPWQSSYGANLWRMNEEDPDAWGRFVNMMNELALKDADTMSNLLVGMLNPRACHRLDLPRVLRHPVLHHNAVQIFQSTKAQDDFTRS
ncbi:MAG: hypothetical protein Q9170_008347 [Blastenia crenularia]